jgi:hypothetical protein
MQLSQASGMFKQIRILILLLILLGVALGAWRTQAQAQAWKTSQYIYLYPIIVDAQGDTYEYTRSLNTESWREIEAFFNQESQAYGLPLVQPFRLHAGPIIRVAPPELPSRPSTLAVISWSLQMRWWAWRHTPDTAVKPSARIYLVYHSPQPGLSLPHSVGVAKARLGVAHLFATPTMHGSNQMVIAHELLHIYGALDHYDLSTNQPLHPYGYAEPDLQPRWPQTQAEIMGGRIPISADNSRIPSSLNEVIVGPATAAAIGWVK